MHPGMKMGYSRRHHKELGSLISGNEMDFLCRKASRKKEAGKREAPGHSGGFVDE